MEKGQLKTIESSSEWALIWNANTDFHLQIKAWSAMLKRKLQIGEPDTRAQWSRDICYNKQVQKYNTIYEESSCTRNYDAPARQQTHSTRTSSLSFTSCEKFQINSESTILNRILVVLEQSKTEKEVPFQYYWYKHSSRKKLFIPCRFISIHWFFSKGHNIIHIL